jgi:Zinc finger, C3HC4 type (RING finger)/CDK-activating kinase assembly factor MAT1
MDSVKWLGKFLAVSRKEDVGNVRASGPSASASSEPPTVFFSQRQPALDKAHHQALPCNTQKHPSNILIMSRAGSKGGASLATHALDKLEDPGGELHVPLSDLQLRSPNPQRSKLEVFNADLDAMSDTEEECPYCHSKRYLRQNMRFMVNPDCYHKLCESCVDRLFGKGPRVCPIKGCGKTLRRNRFRYPTFGDLQMEREVDIRRKVAQM